MRFSRANIILAEEERRGDIRIVRLLHKCGERKLRTLESVGKLGWENERGKMRE